MPTRQHGAPFIFPACRTPHDVPSTRKGSKITRIPLCRKAFPLVIFHPPSRNEGRCEEEIFVEL
jgi:hypothetical protein